MVPLKEEALKTHRETPRAYVYVVVTILQRQQEGGYLQVKERCFRRNQICQYPDLGLPTSRTERKSLLCKARSLGCRFVMAALAD